jgi:hypothetical protein
MASDALDLFRQVGPWKRGQVVWALWRTSTGPAVPRTPSAVPKFFARRVAKVIELGVPFDAEQRPGRPGTDLEFSLTDAAEIGIALDLLDVGLPQLEVAQSLKIHRVPIRAAIEAVQPADAGTFLLFPSRMVVPAALHRGNPFAPAIGEPVVVQGASALLAELSRLSGLDRKRIVIEIGDLVERLGQSLAMAIALLIRRGRH